jgi:hypothetical protein
MLLATVLFSLISQPGITFRGIAQTGSLEFIPLSSSVPSSHAKKPLVTQDFLGPPKRRNIGFYPPSNQQASPFTIESNQYKYVKKSYIQAHPKVLLAVLISVFNY